MTDDNPFPGVDIDAIHRKRSPMVFPASGARTDATPDTRTTRDLLLAIDRKLDILIDALAQEQEEEEPELRTLDGQPAGRERDQTQSLG